VRIGLSGGVGSGKSTVAALLAAHGAVIVDADKIAREVVEPGTEGFAEVVARFGADVVTEGRLDRPKLAQIVFNDDAARRDLNAIVHPRVGARTAELLAAVGDDEVVVYDVPLLVESNMSAGFDAVVIVEAPADLRVQRLAGRGMPEDDARARMASQASDEQRRAVADEIVVNSGSLEDLERQVDEMWRRLTAPRAGASS
jgi:dephospho-CoA kinase